MIAGINASKASLDGVVMPQLTIRIPDMLERGDKTSYFTDWAEPLQTLAKSLGSVIKRAAKKSTDPTTSEAPPKYPGPL